MEDEARPLSSEDMILRAREELARPPDRDLPVISDEDLLDDLDLVESIPDTATSALPRRRATGRRPVPQDPFLVQKRSDQANPRSVAAIVAIALLIMGIGVALALFAASAP